MKSSVTNWRTLAFSLRFLYELIANPLTLFLLLLLLLCRHHRKETMAVSCVLESLLGDPQSDQFQVIRYFSSSLSFSLWLLLGQFFKFPEYRNSFEIGIPMSESWQNLGIWRILLHFFIKFLSSWTASNWCRRRFSVTAIPSALEPITSSDSALLTATDKWHIRTATIRIFTSSNSSIRKWWVFPEFEISDPQSQLYSKRFLNQSPFKLHITLSQSLFTNKRTLVYKTTRVLTQVIHDPFWFTAHFLIPLSIFFTQFLLFYRLTQEPQRPGAPLRITVVCHWTEPSCNTTDTPTTTRQGAFCPRASSPKYPLKNFEK